MKWPGHIHTLMRIWKSIQFEEEREGEGDISVRVMALTPYCQGRILVCRARCLGLVGISAGTSWGPYR